MTSNFDIYIEDIFFLWLKKNIKNLFDKVDKISQCLDQWYGVNLSKVLGSWNCY